MEATERILAKKLATITGELSGQIHRTGQKKGQTRSGPEFSYPVLNESDVLGPGARVLAARGIGFLPEVLSVDHLEANFETKSKHLCDVLGRFTFLDGESGESFVDAMPGSALETGDGTGIAKACGDATKSFLRKTFLLSAPAEGERPRNNRHTAAEEPKTSTPVASSTSGKATKLVSQAQIGRLYAIAAKHSVPESDIRAFLDANHHVTDLKMLTMQQYDAVCDWVQSQ